MDNGRHESSEHCWGKYRSQRCQTDATKLKLIIRIQERKKAQSHPEDPNEAKVLPVFFALAFILVVNVVCTIYPCRAWSSAKVRENLYRSGSQLSSATTTFVKCVRRKSGSNCRG